MKKAIGKIPIKREKAFIERFWPCFYFILVTSSFNNFVVTDIANTGDDGFTDVCVFF